MMSSDVFEGPAIWSRDWRAVYLRLKGTATYLQIEGLNGNLPLIECSAFDPGSTPTVDDLLSVLPGIRGASWLEEPKGSFPSVELNAFMPNMRVAIIGIADADNSIPSKERISKKFGELLLLKDNLLCLHAR